MSSCFWIARHKDLQEVNGAKPFCQNAIFLGRQRQKDLKEINGAKPFFQIAIFSG
jgi:hypothetical protein